MFRLVAVAASLFCFTAGAAAAATFTTPVESTGEQNLQATANLQATYTYTPVSTGGGAPEPVAWGMMLIGMAGAGGALRGARRRPRAA